MRTTVDLPAQTHRQVKQLAAQRGCSLSAVIAELTERGLVSQGEPLRLATDPTTGLPVAFIGRRIAMADTLAFLDDDE